MWHAFEDHKLSGDILTVPPDKFTLPHVSAIEGGKLKITRLAWLIEALRLYWMTWIFVKGVNQKLLVGRAQIKSDFGSTESSGDYKPFSFTPNKVIFPLVKGNYVIHSKLLLRW
jgi:hypothetical protein